MKELFLLRGLPGSGKSTVANNLARCQQTSHFEADQFFMQEGEYAFDPAKIKDAHAYCMNSTEWAMKQGRNRIVVSNTFTREWEMTHYYRLAEKYGYQVHSLIVENRHNGVNEHGVPEATLQAMKDRFEIKL